MEQILVYFGAVFIGIMLGTLVGYALVFFWKSIKGFPYFTEMKAKAL